MKNPETILLYARPWNVSQMEHLVRGVWGADAILTVTSEHRTIDASGLTSVFNATYRKTGPGAKPGILTEVEVADIVLRCRLLRSLEPGRARRLVVAMEHAVDTVLSTVQPSAMLSLMIDNYVMDIFHTLCGKRGVRFIGLVPSFVQEHFRITARGEYVGSRTITEDEIDAALSTLVVKDYRPDFLVQSEKEMRAKMWRLWRRNLPKPLWFGLRRLSPGEFLNYHYWVSQILSTRYWRLFPRRIKGVSGPALTALGEDGGLPLIYLPLQMSPEATIDYWSADTRWIDYEKFVLDLVRRYRDKWRFVVKEHPNILGYRTRGFYRRLEAEPNCVMASPSMPSNELITLCRGVLVCTGTVGFEAALRGRPVLTDSAPYYAPPGALLPLDALDGEIPRSVEDPAQQRALVTHVLRGILPGRFLNNGEWNPENPEHRAWNDTMAASIRGYLDHVDADKAHEGDNKTFQQTSS